MVCIQNFMKNTFLIDITTVKLKKTRLQSFYTFFKNQIVVNVMLSNTASLVMSMNKVQNSIQL